MKLSSSIHSGSSTSSSPERDPGTKRESAFGRLCRKLSPRSSSSSADRGAPPAAENAPAGVDCRKLGEFRRVFDSFDENGDGRISPAELRSCLTSLGGDLSSEEAEAEMVVWSLDLDGEGMLWFERLMESGGEEERRKDLEEAFGMYEMEGSGASSLKRTLGRLGETRSMEDCKTMIQAFDLNGYGDGEARNMADQTVTPQRNDEQLSRQQQQQESFGSTKRFHIIFTSFKLLVITHFNSQPTEAFSHLVLQLYIICEAIYLIALIQVTKPTNPNPIYKYLYIIFGTLGAELLLWTSLSLAMWLIVNMCLFVFVLASAGLLKQVSNQLLEIVQSSNEVWSNDVSSIEVSINC